MALYFAAVDVQSPVSRLYDFVVAHYAAVPANSIVPTLLPPVPNMVAWLKLDTAATDVYVLGTSDTSPFYTRVQLLPVEFPDFGRNLIDLRSIYIEVPTGGAIVNMSFVIL